MSNDNKNIITNSNILISVTKDVNFLW